MFINLKDIQLEPLEIDTALSVGELEGPGGERMPVTGARLRGEASRGDLGVDLDARLTAMVTVLCSRCTEAFSLPIDTELSLTLVPARKDDPAKEEGAPTGDEDRLFPVEDGKADLAAIAAEQIYLALPLKPVCKKECKGLCPVCGVNRNQEECACSVEEIDPRLAPLLQFKLRRNPPAAR